MYRNKRKVPAVLINMLGYVPNQIETLLQFLHVIYWKN